MSDDMGRLTPVARLLYIGLWGHADRSGYMKFSKTSLKLSIIPFEHEQFDDAMNQLIENNHVQVIEHDGEQFLFLPKFSLHQSFPTSEKSSVLSMALDGLDPLDIQNVRQVSDTCQTDVRQERKGRERKGKEGIKKKTNKKENSPEFEEFWQLYPNKKSKREAEKAFHRINPDASLLAEMLAGMRNQIAERQDHDRHGLWMPTWPHAATWLNNERWTDHVKSAAEIQQMAKSQSGTPKKQGAFDRVKNNLQAKRQGSSPTQETRNDKLLPW